MNTLIWTRVKELRWANDLNPSGIIYKHKMIPLTVVLSKAIMQNGDEWKHVMASRKDRLPSWTEISKIRHDFIGPQKEAFHILPKESDHNLLFFMLHIWSPIKTLTEMPNLKLVKTEVPFV